MLEPDSRVFGLAILPIMIFMGGAIDYGRATSLKSKAQGAVDAAALAGAAAGAKLQAGGSVAAATSVGDAAARMTFNTYVGSWQGAGVPTFNPGGTVTQTNVQYSSTAALQVPTAFLKLAGLETMSVSVNSTAKVTAGTQSGATQFIDIYVLVDASQSMGLGASATDQANMTTSMGCMLACHNGAPGNAADTFVTARNAGNQLRFDVVKNALNAIVSQAQTNMTSTGATIRFGVYSFASNFKTETDITPNYSAITSAIQNMDVHDSSVGGTSLKYALDQVRLKIVSTGDGSSAASPKAFVLLMTDGVGNSVATVHSTVSPNFYPAYDKTQAVSQACWPGQTPTGDGSGSVPWFSPPNQPVGSPTYGPPCVPDPTNSPEEMMGGVDPAWCSPIKNSNVTLMSLYTTYIVQTDRTKWRRDYIEDKLIPTIPGNLQNCASSPADYFVANDPAQIMTAANAIFTQIATPTTTTKMGSARLTQ
jgi:Flp pilus assembly protein TadG